MSIKNSLFETALHSFGPANTFAFQMWIGGLVNASFLVESATYPSLKREEVAVPILGKVVNIPTVLNNSGDFVCTIVETQTFEVRYELLRKLVGLTKQVDDADDTNGKGLTLTKSTSGLNLNDLYAFGEQINNLPKLFDITLIPLQAGGVLPTLGTVLRGCYLKEKGQVELNSSAVTTPWKWPVVFHYTALEERVPIMGVPFASDALTLTTIQLGKLINKII